MTITRAQETDLPASAKIGFISSEGDYRQAVVEARRLAGSSVRVSQADLPIVLDPDAAAALAESWLFDAWSSRERVGLVLPPSKLALEPSDAIFVDVGGQKRLLRITEIGDHGARAISARSLDPDVFTGAAQPQRPADLPTPMASGWPDLVFLDLPLLTGDEPPTAGYVVAAQVPWPGPLAIYRSPETTGFNLEGFVNVSGAIGVTLDPLPAGPEGRIDRATRLRIRLTSGASALSVSRLKLLSGANAAAVQSSSGDWEVMQFETAVLVAANTYELSNLLRGQGGTEAAMSASTLAPGARFVLLGAGTTRLDLAAGDVGLPYTWRVGPASRDLGSDRYVEMVHAFAGLGQRPLSPVFVRGFRTGGDLALSWKRRTRMGGDNWSDGEVPLSEVSEAYEVDILSGTVVKRTIASLTPAALYTSAQQVTDFGSPQAAVSVRVYQLSEAWGRGSPRAATI